MADVAGKSARRVRTGGRIVEVFRVFKGVVTRNSLKMKALRDCNALETLQKLPQRSKTVPRTVESSFLFSKNSVLAI